MKYTKLVAFVLTIVYAVSLAFSYSPINFIGKSYAEPLATNDEAVIPAPTPTPKPYNVTVIDNSVPADFSQNGEWSVENYGYRG